MSVGRFAPALLALALSAACRAEDWPNWRGPRHDAISRETGLLRAFPKEGPRILWRQPLTGGYSAPVAAEGRVVTQSKDGKFENVLAFDAVTGKRLWEFRYPCDYSKYETLDLNPSANNPVLKQGPRATPAVDGGRVYAIGTTGLLHCLDLKTGQLVWKRDVLAMADRPLQDTGYCNSPLLSGDRLFISPGGSKGNSLAALDKKDGHTLWQSLDDPPGYSCPVLIQLEGKPQLLHFTGRGLLAVDPADGRLLGRYDWKTRYDYNISTPVYADGRVFLSSAYGKGCALLQLQPQGDPELVYKSTRLQNYFASNVLVNKNLYGFHSQDTLNDVRCLDFATGRVKWSERSTGRGNLLVADGLIVALNENGELILADVNPERYVERARAKVMSYPCFTMPALANGRLYLRNETQLACVKLTTDH